MPDSLPDFIAPMLAKLTRPFDSEDFLYELKWDGFRGLVFLEDGSIRLRSRRDRDLLRRFPELDFLRALPPGMVLDGEIVLYNEGKADFQLMLSRTRMPHGDPSLRKLADSIHATYIVFDMLWVGHESIMSRPLVERRALLEELAASFDDPRLVFSGGIVGEGLSLYAEACAQDIEGVVAKKLSSRYLAGKRTDAWQKFKKTTTIYCAIVGFEADGDDDFKSLVVATDVNGVLTCVGKVGSGVDESVRAELNELLWGMLCDEPIVDCPFDATWVEGGLYCTVSYMERTRDGMLRAPVFKELIGE